MTGERVTELRYGWELRPGLSYAPAINHTVSLDGFSGQLTASNAKFTPTEHFCSVDEARTRLEPQLEAWRQWTVLQGWEDWLPFKYEGAAIEPWTAPPDGSFRMIVGHATLKIRAHALRLDGENSQFPPLPPRFSVDECVGIGLQLLRYSIETPQHALRCGYALLSLLENEHKTRAGLAAALQIQRDTLDDFGDIVSLGGSGAEARKFRVQPNEQRIDLTAERRTWLINLSRVLIQRQGQFAAGALPQGEYAYRRP